MSSSRRLVQILNKLKECPSDEKKLQPIFMQLTTAVKEGVLNSPVNFDMIMENSELSRLTHDFLRNDSILDMIAKYEFYQVFFGFIVALAEDYFGFLFLSQPFTFLNANNNNNNNSMDLENINCVSLITSLNEQASLFLTLQQQSSESNSKGIEDIHVKIARKIMDINHIITEKNKNKKRKRRSLINDSSTSTNSSNSSNRNQEAAKYIEELRKLRFEAIDMQTDISECRMTHSLVKLHEIQSSSIARGKLSRLASEMSNLASSLPIEIGSAIFVRCDESRMDVLKALIIGPEGTPYENGCFEFDILLPPSYPNVPPIVKFLTTDNNTMRFNPNLYADGKVCLSLLGTWTGPSWDPTRSTLLQVLVSIQSLILVPDPYFNEPGYEMSMHSVAGKMSSLAYNLKIKQATLRIAILEALLNPSYCFKEVIYTHFRIKQQSIKIQLLDWKEFDTSFVNRPNKKLTEILKIIEMNATTSKPCSPPPPLPPATRSQNHLKSSLLLTKTTNNQFASTTTNVNNITVIKAIEVIMCYHFGDDGTINENETTTTTSSSNSSNSKGSSSSNGNKNKLKNAHQNNIFELIVIADDDDDDDSNHNDGGDVIDLLIEDDDDDEQELSTTAGGAKKNNKETAKSFSSSTSTTSSSISHTTKKNELFSSASSTSGRNNSNKRSRRNSTNDNNQYNSSSTKQNNNFIDLCDDR